MTDDELVLTSFVLDEESLVDTWWIDSVAWGQSRVPSAGPDSEVVALTDHRFMWFDGELQAIDREAIETVERADFTHTTRPALVTAGRVAFGLGVVASIGALFLTDLDFLTATMPAMTGFGALLGMIVTARVRGETGTEVDLLRVVVETDEEVATLWGEGEEIRAVADALEDDDQRSAGDGTATEDAGGDTENSDEAA
jgi:hypothetical protein